MNPFGYFNESKREYVITCPDTPLPWLNCMGQDEFFGVCTNTAGGYSLWEAAQLRQLTRYRHNNVPYDVVGRPTYFNEGGLVGNRGCGLGCPSQRPLARIAKGIGWWKASSRRIAIPHGGVSEARVFKHASRPSSRSGREAQARHSDPLLCFVLMPFGLQDLLDVYDYYVKPSIEGCGLRCERADDLFGANVVMDDIRERIERARLLVADLTGRNPNVFYEIGMAHARDKDVLLLAQSMNDVPFDLRHRRILVYEFSPKGCKELERSIVENVSAMLAA